MAVVFSDPETIEARQGSQTRDVIRVTLAATDTTRAIQLPRYPATVKLIAGAATSVARVQYTTSLPSRVTAGSAVWSTWANGDTSDGAAESEVLTGPITALRAVCDSGTAVLEVVT